MPKRNLIPTTIIAIAGSAILASCGNLQSIQDLTNAVTAGLSGSGDGNVAAGLRQALEVGTERTIVKTSKPGGFSSNPLLRIALPGELDTMAKGLRLIGMGGQVDSLDDAMNRAAEKASAEAKPVFLDAITGMTLTDATGILRGGNTAATEYFRGKTSSSLAKRFRPIIESNLGKVGVYKDYKQLLDAYTNLPLTSAPSLDLTEHVTQGTLDGLFKVLGQEETKIRKDPAARSTELLQDVFGN